MAPYCLASVSPDVRAAHLRVPPHLHPASGRVLVMLFDKGWRLPVGEDEGPGSGSAAVRHECPTAAGDDAARVADGKAARLDEGVAAQAALAADATPVAPTAGDGASDSTRSTVVLDDEHDDGAAAWAAWQLAEAVRGIVGRTPKATLDEVIERLAALGLEPDRAQTKKEMSKAHRERARGGGQGGARDDDDQTSRHVCTETVRS